MLPAWSMFCVPIQKDLFVLHSLFSCLWWNWHLCCMDGRRMLFCNRLRCNTTFRLIWLFPFISGYRANFIGHVMHTELTILNDTYSKPLSDLYCNCSRSRSTFESLNFSLQWRFETFESISIFTYNLCTPNDEKSRKREINGNGTVARKYVANVLTLLSFEAFVAILLLRCSVLVARLVWSILTISSVTLYLVN